MAIRTLLKFRNLDLTKDINDRYSKLIGRGVFEGGTVVPVPSQLKIDLLPFKAVSVDGMVVEETSDSYRLSCPAGQTTVIACRSVYVQNNDPDIEIVAIEKTTFDALINKDFHIVFAHVVVPLAATQVVPTNIELKNRDIVDKVSRSRFRGYLSSAGLLPGATTNKAGDFYVVANGIGGTPHLYGWDGLQWIIMTDAATVTADLAAHRQNLFVNEKHLTDLEKLAVAGTSGTAPSGSNKFIDNADTRVPTQLENDALLGSDGNPSGTNRYVTQEYPLAVPSEKVSGGIPVLMSFELLTMDGPVYVGKDGLLTANQYFRFYDPVEQREYTTLTGIPVDVADVYKDIGLTVQLNPSLDPGVDADGFYSSGTLYVKFTVMPDTTVRILYGKRQFLGTMPIDVLLRRNLNDGQASADVITTVEAIKGRDWDVTPPVNEQNIELRKDVVDLKEYVSAVFRADHVVGDFTNVKNVPDFLNHFVPNVGIPQNYSFENTGLVTYTYNPTTGQVTYTSPVTIVGPVVANQHVFIDSNLDEFKVTSVIDSQNILITRRTGTIPVSIGTTVSISGHGSIKPDNNPRRINLSTLGFFSARERIEIREIEVAKDEFNPKTRNIAFQTRTAIRSPFYREPRVRLYGSFKNRDSGSKSRVVCTGKGTILLTGFFSTVYLLADLKNQSPNIVVKVDGDNIGTTIDLSKAGNTANLGVEGELQQQAVLLMNGLSEAVPHTIEIEIGDAVDDFVFFGFDLYKNANTTISILPGRAFVQSDLYRSDAITTIASNTEATRSRGSVVSRYVNRSLVQQTTVTSGTDFDGVAAGPSGVAVAATTAFTVTSGLPKFALYRVGDIVKLITAGLEEVKQIASLGGGGLLNFSANVLGSGAAVLLHVASTTDDENDPVREYTRYSISDLGAKQGIDFSTVETSPSDRIFTVEDGTTSIVGSQVKLTATDIDGSDYALELDTALSSIRIRAVASRCDIICVKATAGSATVTLDGSDPYTISTAGFGTLRIPLWLNARYQTHEALITGGAGFKIVGIILHEPRPATPIEGSLLATQNFVARYDSSVSENGEVIPTGCVAIDPYTSGGLFVNGTGSGTVWTYAFNLATAPAWGRTVSTSLEGSYFEYFFVGEGFEMEYYAKNDQGKPIIFLNGTIANIVNFPTAAYKGVISATGEVDMYDASATPLRKKFSITGLPFNTYTFKIAIQTPRQKNASSVGFDMTLGTFYEINYNGRLAITPSKGFREADFAIGPASFRDDRNFDSGAVSREEVPVIRTIVQAARCQRVVLTNGTTSVSVVFASPFDDMDYAATCTMYNTVDGSPLFQPILITAISVSGFTAQWDNPLISSNYSLNYTAIKFS